MAGFVRGDLVVMPFPFSDLTGAKKRPALVVATPPGSDLILCQVTSLPKSDGIPLEQDDLASGRLHRPSSIRPAKLFTAHPRLILYRAGAVNSEKLDQVIDRAVAIIRGDRAEA